MRNINSIEKAKLMQIIGEHVPREVTRNQLIDWFIKTQEEYRNFFLSCTVKELLECARAADIEIKNTCKNNTKIEVPKMIKKEIKKPLKFRKINKNITKCDIIEVWINQDQTLNKTCSKLHCGLPRLKRLIKEYGIEKPEKPKGYNPEEIRKMYVEDIMSLVKISEKIGLSQKKIYCILTKECKIKLRSRHEARRIAC